MRQLPLLRFGRPYVSKTISPVRHFLTGAPLIEVSQANSGMVSWDMRRSREASETLRSLPVERICDILAAAADRFENDALDLGGGWTQDFHQYLADLSATTGMPQTLCIKNARKMTSAMRDMPAILQGLMRGLRPAMLDEPATHTEHGLLSFRRETDVLGAVLPSNSPGVHTLWLPALALKTPVVLKPGGSEPWSPYRLTAALRASGLPPQAISLYPTDHAGARGVLLNCGRAMVFGDKSTVAPWQGDHRIQIHGPGWSKILIGEDGMRSWRRHLDLIQTSVCENSGRSCLNASAILVHSDGRHVAQALAEKMVEIDARPLDHPRAALSAFSNPDLAHMISDVIDDHLKTPGARDLTADLRDGPRVVEVEGATFLRPTLVYCEDSNHPLMQMEFLFPFAAVAQVPQEHMVQSMGETLVATALTSDQGWIEQLMDAPNIDRLNLGPIPTCVIRRDQPHEGNLFEFIFRQRAYQIEPMEQV